MKKIIVALTVVAFLFCAQAQVTNPPDIGTELSNAVHLIHYVQNLSQQATIQLSTNQASTNAPSTISGVASIGQSTINPFLGLVAIGVPLLIALIKTKIWTKIPPQALPILATGLGVLATWLIDEANLANLNPIYGALLGAAGTGVREIKDQLFPATPTIAGTQQSPPEKHAGT